MDESISHLVSARIVQFAKQHEATILVFEHLGHLKPEKGKYSRRGNSKRAFWMKGRIFKYAKYKAYSEGLLISRVNPRNTSRECARRLRTGVSHRVRHGLRGQPTGASRAKEGCGTLGKTQGKLFGDEMSRRFEKKRTNDAVIYQGIGLRSSSPDL